MTVDAHRPIGTASDTLMTQINNQNVVGVHAVLAAQAGRMLELLEAANWMRDIPLPGRDPISADAKTLFQPKVNQILDVHWAHYREVSEAAARLREAALQYGHTDDEIDTAFGREATRFAQHT